MTDPQNIITIPGAIQNAIIDKVIFSPEGLTICRPFSFARRMFIPGNSIAAFRFGLVPLKFSRFSIGHQYFIEIRNFKHEIYRIKLNTYNSSNRRQYYGIWAGLLQNLWDHYLSNQLSYYTELYNIRQFFELAGVTFHTDGITWDNNQSIPWNKIAVKSYQNYFIIYHTDNPALCKYSLFSLQWNAVILQSLLKDVIEVNKRVPKSSV